MLNAPPPDFAAAARAIIAVGRFCAARGWAPATSGNYSMRLADGRIAITASGCEKGELTADDILLVDAMGRPGGERRPSAETLLHAGIYRAFPDCNAVIHTHSREAAVLTLRDPGLEALTLRDYELLKAYPGVVTHDTAVAVPIFDNNQDMMALQADVAERMPGHVPACLIRGHGLYAWGPDMAAAPQGRRGHRIHAGLRTAIEALMTVLTTPEGIHAVVTDIEGTTTPIAFVKEVLFPYAQAHLADFVRRRADDPAVRGLLEEARTLAGEPRLDATETIALLLRWSSQDRKAGPLKALQGLIWADGYAAGAFAPEVYDDAVAKLREWRAQGLALYVYSSGSTVAQTMLFRHAAQGDLTSLFSGYFDTWVGGKLERASYRRLAETIGVRPEALLFLSDHPGELDAARSAGLATVLVDRDGAHGGGAHPRVESFSTIEIGVA